jgi:hypothetical protein
MKRIILALSVLLGSVGVMQLADVSPAHAAYSVHARKRVCYNAYGALFWHIKVEYINTSNNKYQTLTSPNRTAHGDARDASGSILGNSSYWGLWTAAPGSYVSYQSVLPYQSPEPSHVVFWRPNNSDANPVPYTYDYVWFSANEPLQSCTNGTW